MFISHLSHYFLKVAFVLSVSVITLSITGAEAKPVKLGAEEQKNLELLTLDAAREGDLKTIIAYLDSGFSPNILSKRGDSLLTLATYYGHAEVVDALLLNEKTKVNLVNKMGFTALTGAAFRGHDVILKNLIKHGAEVDGVNNKGQTALMFAAMFGQKSAVAILISHGADASRLTPSGKTAANLASEQGNSEMGQLIADAVLKRERLSGLEKK